MPGFLMIWGLMWTLAPVAVYWDATAKRIGRVPSSTSFLNMPAGGWGFCVLMLGILALPLYLFMRKNLIEKAAREPVIIPENKRLIMAMVLLAASSFFYFVNREMFMGDLFVASENV